LVAPNAKRTPAPRLAAFDLDGTLLNSDSEVSAYTRSVIDELAGPNGRFPDHHFVVATGRGLDSASTRLESIEPIRWIICDNGAALYDLHRDELVSHSALEPAAVGPFMTRLRAQLPELAIGWGSLSEGFAWTPEFAQIFGVEASQRQVISQDDPVPGDLLKLLLAHPEHSSDDLLTIIGDLCADGAGPGSDGLAVTTSGFSFVEVTAPGIDKSVRLAELCQRLGVDREATIAFGDAMNDHDMLRWVGTGYAMANADPLVQQVADVVTERTNDDDGVAHALLSVFDPT
jgi:Cof subfamily protein (haloacid dehalogenase superfamily)